MGVINVQGPNSGLQYPVKIAGDTPTAQEQARIDQFLQQKEAEFAQFSASRYGAPQVPETQDDVDGPEGGFRSALGAGLDQLQIGYGSALEGLGSVTGLQGLENYGADVVERNNAELAEKQTGFTQYEDIDGVGDSLKFYGETIGQQGAQLGSTLAGAGAGFLVGGPVGSILGGIAVNLPYFYGDNREAQKDAIDRGLRTEMNEGAAALTAIPQSALDAIADRFLVGKLINPKALGSGGLFTRAAKGVGVGAIAEVPTEIGQEVLNRLQAGLPLTDEEAMETYKQVAIAAGLTGGTVRGVTNVVAGDAVQAELREDQAEQAAAIKAKLERANEAKQDGDEVVGSRVLNIPLDMPVEEKQETLLLPAPDSRIDAQEQKLSTKTKSSVAQNSFNQNQYDAALQVVQNKSRYTFNDIRNAIKTRTGAKTVPNSLIHDIRDQMVNDGVLMQTKKDRTGYAIDSELAKSMAATRDRIATTQQEIETKKLRREELIQNARRKQQINNDRRTATRFLNQAEKLSAEIEQAESMVPALIDALDNSGKRTDPVNQIDRPLDLQKADKRVARKQRVDDQVGQAPAVSPEAFAAESARFLAAEAVNKTRKDTYTAQEQKVFNALSKRLKRLNLPDVRLTTEKLIRDPDGGFVEGEYNPESGKKILTLSMEAIDPNATPQEQYDVLRGVMNHEVIHALKDLGLFTPKEYETLVRTAAKKKYVAMKNGEAVERRYTYLERAQSMYSTSDLAIQEEESVAELFRDYADRKIKLSGKPRTLMERIKDFFNAIFRGHDDADITSAEDIFDDIISGKIGERERGEPTADVEADARRWSKIKFEPVLPVAPDDAREHKLPSQLLIKGSGTPPTVSITQAYTPANAARNNSAIEQILEQHPNATDSVDNWVAAMEDAVGGEFLPAPPLVAIEYSQNPERMAEKLEKLTPELRKGVDEGFAFVEGIRDIYQSGNATPRMTMDLFVWGILSRGAGPVQQEGAFIDVIDAAYPLLEKGTVQPLTEDDLDMWMNTVSTAIPDGSPGKQVTMNVNAAAKLVRAMSQYVDGTERTILSLLHEQMSDPDVPAAEIRETFLANTKGAGIDNKVLSFILLVGGKDDVLVMDRIQGRHMWDDGRYGGANIYDGIGPNGEGLNGIFRGPRGILVTRMLEDGMRKNIQKAYEMVGRPEDASLGRWHWETWVIEGEQVVNHGTLQAVINGSPIGTSVTEGKTDTFSSGMTYIRGENAAVVQYPLSEGGSVFMTPTRFKEFTQALSGDAKKAKSSTGIFKNGKFKVTERADIPWFTRPEVDAQALDALAREYQNAKPNGAVLTEPERLRAIKDTSRGGAANPDRRYVESPREEDTDFSDIVGNEEVITGRRFSSIPTNPNQLIANPYSKGGSSPIFGSIKERGQMIPVVLPAGEHTTFEQRGGVTEAGRGLYHIQQRGHDRELMRFSKMDDVKKAIHDIMYRWGKQGFTDGRDVIGYPSRGGYNLEWVGNLPSKSPPMKLVLKPRKMGSGYVFDVQTFYLDLEAKDRAVVNGKKRYSVVKMADSAELFEDSALREAANQNDGSREILVSMPIRDFLRVANEGSDDDKAATVEGLIRSGTKFRTMPFLYVTNNGDGTGSVSGHEGRHRARAMQNLGYEEMPVVIISQAGGGPSIRWGRQDNEKSMDYVDPSQRPKVLRGESRSLAGLLDYTVPMPDTGLDAAEADAPATIESIFEAFGEEGALLEFPDIGENVDAYVMNNDRSAITRALQSDNYAEYKRMLDAQLNEAYPDGVIKTERTIGYADPMAEKTKTEVDVPVENVLLVGNPQERELIVNLDGVGRSVSVPTTGRRFSAVPLVGQAMQQRDYDQNYTRASDFIAKAFRIAADKDRSQEIADEILRRFQDAFLPVGRMIKELKDQGMEIADAMDTYLKEELYHRKTANELNKRQEGIHKNAVDAAQKFNVTNSQMQALKKVSDDAAIQKEGFVAQALKTSKNNNKLALADIYLYASHAKERNAYIRKNTDQTNEAGSGMSDAEADAILRWFAGSGQTNVNAAQELDAAVRAIVEDTNKVRIDGGLLPSDIEDNYNSYVPLRGKFDPDNEDVISQPFRRGAGFGARGREDKKALGRYDYATDILATTLTQNQNSVVRAEKNLVGQSFLKLLRADTDKTRAYAEIIKFPLTRTQKKGAKLGAAPDMAKLNDENFMVIKENGQDVIVEFNDTRIAKAMQGATGMGANSLGVITRGMAKVNRYLSNINTSYNPEFVVSNFLRDLQTAGVNVNQYGEEGMTRDILRGITPALKGIKKAIRDGDKNSEWAQIYNDFVDAGGKNATNQIDTIADQMNNLQGLLGEIGDAGSNKRWGVVKNKFVGKGKSLLQFMEDYNTIVENGVRVATYKSLLDRGFSRERAAQAAGNVTVNFSKGGEYRSLMNAWYLFYNASLQGSFALLNAALRSKKVQKIWAGVIAAGLLQDQLNAALSDEDEDGKLVYDKIPDYVKEHNLILPDPFGFTDRSYIVIPMPYGLNMAHNIGRASSQFIRGGADLAETGNSIVGTIVDTVSPIGGVWTEGPENLIAPTIADPFIDIIGNEDFAGRPIYKEGFPGDRTPQSQLYWSTTSPTAKWFAENINSLTGGTDAKGGMVDVSPDVLEFWFEYATGGIGRFAQRTAELPTRLSEEGLGEEVYREIPFVRKIVGSVSDREDLGDYIEKRDRILTAGDEIKAAVESQDRERLNKGRVKYAEELRFLALVKNTENARRKISRQMNSVRDNKTLSDERKKELLEQLEDRRNKIIQRANQLLKKFD